MMVEIDEGTLTQVINLVGEIRREMSKDRLILLGIHPQHVRDLHDRLQKMRRTAPSQQ